jgi:acetylornithine deacetylase/succinyl-diaminopimelate desuccinylase-like protein
MERACAPRSAAGLVRVFAITAVFMIPRPVLAQRTPDLSKELAAARQVLQSPAMSRALAYIDGAEAETVQEWLSLCNAYGPSGDEGRRSRLIYRLFRIYGLDNVHIDDALNVIGIRRGTRGGPTVVLNAHHDNVALWPGDQPVEAFVADGRVWCPAAADDLMGVTQMLTLLRAMNAADITTAGDIWFVAVTGEEAPTGPDHPDASPGMSQLVRANVPRNLDWRRGDIIVQFHGGGGEGVSTGSTPVRNRSQLRIFAPFDGDRWAPHAVDALGRIIARIGTEVRDPRSTRVAFDHPAGAPLSSDVLYMNMGMISASAIIARPASEAWVRFDMRSDRQARMDQAHDAIERITREVLSSMGEGFSYTYEINSRNGVEAGIAGFDKVDNAPARMAAAASQALYGTDPVIDPDNGCGDCVRAYTEGMPAFSFRGDVVDHGAGRFERQARSPLASAVRRKTAGHDVTESAEIARVWAGVKHGLLFAVAYAGLSNR